MSEKTKGKWEIMPYTRRDGDNIRWIKATRGKRRLAICQTFKPCAEANARLIAAAPDLLTACKRGHARLLELGQKESHRTLKILKAAIEKTEKGTKEKRCSDSY